MMVELSLKRDKFKGNNLSVTKKSAKTKILIKKINLKMNLTSLANLGAHKIRMEQGGSIFLWLSHEKICSPLFPAILKTPKFSNSLNASPPVPYPHPSRQKTAADTLLLLMRVDTQIRL